MKIRLEDIVIPAFLTLLFLMMLCANLFADAVQNAFDPRTKTLSEKNSILKRKKIRSLANKKNEPKLPLSSVDAKNTPPS